MTNLKFILPKFGSQKFKISVLGMKSRCWQGCAFSAGSGEILLLVFSSFQWLPTILEWLPHDPNLYLQPLTVLSYVCLGFSYMDT